MTRPQDREYDRRRHLANKPQRNRWSRAYYYANKKRMRTYQDQYWNTQEGYAVILRAGKKRDLKAEGYSAKAIKKILDAMPTRAKYRKGKLLPRHQYKHASKYSGMAT